MDKEFIDTLGSTLVRQASDNGSASIILASGSILYVRRVTEANKLYQVCIGGQEFKRSVLFHKAVYFVRAVLAGSFA